MFGKFFDTTSVDAFAAWAVGELRKSLPPERVEDPSKQTAKRREQLDERIRRRASDLASAGLNVYQKAKLGTALQEALHSAGYPESFCKDFSYDVVKLVALVSTQSR